MHSYIILFTDEYHHVIALVFLLSHFTLKFCLKIPAATRGVSASKIIYSPFSHACAVAARRCEGLMMDTGNREGVWSRPSNVDDGTRGDVQNNA
jgi:hypothetical protein